MRETVVIWQQFIRYNDGGKKKKGEDESVQVVGGDILQHTHTHVHSFKTSRAGNNTEREREI